MMTESAIPSFGVKAGLMESPLLGPSHVFPFFLNLVVRRDESLGLFIGVLLFFFRMRSPSFSRTSGRRHFFWTVFLVSLSSRT